MKHVVNLDVDIILELGLITSSLSIIFCNHKNKIIVTNLDGLEWKRTKWNWLVQKLTKLLEKYGIKYSDYIISDNLGIQDYVKKEYNKDSQFIAYGANEVLEYNEEILKIYDLKPYKYFFTIARIEPENNLEMMIQGYIQSKSNLSYIIVGNHITPYADYLKDKYRDKGIYFLGSIFNKDHLDVLRHFSKFYLHGHSVGGTNPALLEAAAAGAFIFSHNNIFNNSVIKNKENSFCNSSELAGLINRKEDNREKQVKENINEIKKTYNWEKIIDEYERYFKEIISMQRS